jgi:hypothetical protein
LFAFRGVQFKVNVTEEIHCFMGGKSVTVLVQVIIQGMDQISIKTPNPKYRPFLNID